MRGFVVILVLILFFGFSFGYAEAQTHRHWRYDLSKLQYGMSSDQVRRIWGKADHMNYVASQNGEIQQWVYIEERNSMRDVRIFLHFVNGEFYSYSIWGDK